MLVDADKVAFFNMDHLFDLPTPAGTFSSPWAKPFCEGGGGMNNPYLELKHGDEVPFAAVEEGLATSFVCYATVNVLSPSRDDYETMKDWLDEEQPFGFPNCTSGSDEQAIAAFYTYCNLRPNKRWTHISQQYQCIPWRTEWMEGKRPYLFHFFNKKPWCMPRGDWLDLEVEQTHSYPHTHIHTCIHVYMHITNI